MRQYIKLVTCIFIAGSGFYAMADHDTPASPSGAFLEPGITYERMDSNLNYPAPFRNSTAVSRGFGLVLRGGIHIYERFFVAADARYALLSYDDNSNAYSTHASSWDIAPVIGYQMKDFGLRVYGGYVLAGNLDPAEVNGFDYRFDQPNGWRLGAGLKLKMFSVNFEWQKLHYSSTRIESRGSIPVATSTDAIKFNGEGLIASVTFPIEF